MDFYSLPFIISILLILFVFFYIFFFRKRGRYKVKIIPFIGFGTRDSFILSGRVIVDRGNFISYSIEFKGKKFIRNYRRLRSIKVPNVTLEINFGFRKEMIKSDEKGYFFLKMNLEEGIKLPIGINRYSIRIIDEKYTSPETFGDFIIIPDKVPYSIICDIDDTILQSNVRKKVRLLLNTLVSNERDMKPMPGMNILLNNLQMGINKTNQNPILYITASPSDLHDKISSFIKTNFFPEGPLLMKKLRGDNKDKLFDTYNYKMRKLVDVFEKFTDMKFVLIGDNTESDIDAFNEIDTLYPDRVLLILIMNVVDEHMDPNRYRKAILCNNAFEAALVCVKNNIISPESAYEVGNELKIQHIINENIDLNEKINNYLPLVSSFTKKRKKDTPKRRNFFNSLKKKDY